MENVEHLVYVDVPIQIDVCLVKERPRLPSGERAAVELDDCEDHVDEFLRLQRAVAVAVELLEETHRRAHLAVARHLQPTRLAHCRRPRHEPSSYNERGVSRRSSSAPGDGERARDAGDNGTLGGGGEPLARRRLRRWRVAAARRLPLLLVEMPHPLAEIDEATPRSVEAVEKRAPLHLPPPKLSQHRPVVRRRIEFVLAQHPIKVAVRPCEAHRRAVEHALVDRRPQLIGRRAARHHPRAVRLRVLIDRLAPPLWRLSPSGGAGGVAGTEFLRLGGARSRAPAAAAAIFAASPLSAPMTPPPPCLPSSSSRWRSISRARIVHKTR